MKNGGFASEEVLLRQEIADLADLLRLCDSSSPDRRSGEARLRVLLARVGGLPVADLKAVDDYYVRLTERLMCRALADETKA